MALLSTMSGGFDDELYKLAQPAGFPILQGAKEGMVVLKHLIDFSRRVAERPSAPTITASEPAIRREGMPAVVGSTTRILTAQQSMNLLAEYGIPIARGRVAASAEEAVEYGVVDKVLVRPEAAR